MGSSQLSVASEEPFGDSWARRKLDMPRRRRELEVYIDRWLPELRTMAPGLVVDIGPGPGDFLRLCMDVGHEGLGIDAPDGRGGMGGAYQKLAREHCEEFGVEVVRTGLMTFLREPFYYSFQDRCVLWHARGSIEQALSYCMKGDPHDAHHCAKLMDWNLATQDFERQPVTWFNRIMAAAFEGLRSGGLLLIAANGSRTGDAWYDAEIRRAAKMRGFELVEQDGLLVHKWRKP